MNGVVIIPTGIGAEIGGHAGDANPMIKLIAGCCDRLVTNPNAVNASDINEMPDNVLYVEGSLIDRFLSGEFQLKEVRQNKILVVCNSPVLSETVNAVNAGRTTIGIDADILILNTPLELIATIGIDGIATGDVKGVDELCAQVINHRFDALAIHTPITVDRYVVLNYFKNGGVNPWGGVEAKASRMIADKLNKPVAHAPIENMTVDDEELYFIHQNKTVDPRIASEVISNCYLHCVLKGLNKAPRLSRGHGLGVNEIDFMISPDGCIGEPHRLCVKQGIPVIVVEENKTIYKNTCSDFIYVKNYWEAVGVIMSMKVGIDKMSVRRPIGAVKVL